jgi:AraC-like DNA-binding protein
MHDYHSFSVVPAFTPAVKLSGIWKVLADKSYDVPAGVRPDNTVIVRTVAGNGTLCSKQTAPISLGSDTLIIVRQNRLLHYYCNGNRWDFWWLEIENSDTLPLPSNRLMHLKQAADETYWLECAFDLLKKSLPDASALASSYVSTLVARWSYEWRKTPQQLDANQETVEKSIARMHASPSDLSIRDLAREAYLSERRFRQVFEKVTGHAPKQFYDMLRLDLARELLEHSSSPASAIAERLGFSSPFHFSRAFKKRYGVAPSALRIRGKER